jgi:hypothetical protein
MDKIRFKCRVCKKVTNQANLNADNEFMLGDGKGLLQCLECGVMGVEDIGVQEPVDKACG